MGNVNALGKTHRTRVCHFAFSFLSWRWQKVTWRAAWGKVSLDVSQHDRLGLLRHALFPALGVFCWIVSLQGR